MRCRAEDCLVPKALQVLLGELRQACLRHDCEEIHRILREAVGDYSPRQSLVDMAWAQRRQDSPPESKAPVKRLHEVARAC